MIRLENWSLRNASVFDFSMTQSRYLIEGKVYGHSKYRDGSKIITSRIVKLLDGNIVVTERGSTYKLGEPAPLNGHHLSMQDAIELLTHLKE